MLEGWWKYLCDMPCEGVLVVDHTALYRDSKSVRPPEPIEREGQKLPTLLATWPTNGRFLAGLARKLEARHIPDGILDVAI